MTNFEKFEIQSVLLVQELIKDYQSFKTDAKKSKLYYKLGNEYQSLQSKLKEKSNFLNNFQEEKEEDKNFDSVAYFKKLTKEELELLIKINSHKAFFDYVGNPNFNDNPVHSNRSLIKWNEKKGTKPVFANFLKLAYGIVYSKDYFEVEEGKEMLAVEQLAQFFSVKMGKGWNSALYREKLNNEKKNIFKELELNYLNNKKPNRNRNTNKQ